MINVIASNMVDRGFEPQTGQGKTVKLLFASSLLGMQHQGVKTNTGWHGIRKMRDKFIHAECCSSELALLKIQLSVLV